MTSLQSWLSFTGVGQLVRANVLFGNNQIKQYFKNVFKFYINIFYEPPNYKIVLF